MSSGAMNWPFLMFTARPDGAGGHQQVGLAAQERRDLEHVDDLGHRLDLARARARRWSPARPNSDFTSARICRLSSKPIERNEEIDVRLALSKLALKIRSMPRSEHVRASCPATSNTSSRLSITQGPAIRANPPGPISISGMNCVVPGLWSLKPGGGPAQRRAGAAGRRRRRRPRPGAVRNAFLRCSSSTSACDSGSSRETVRGLEDMRSSTSLPLRSSTSSSSRRMSPSVTKPASRPSVWSTHTAP